MHHLCHIGALLAIHGDFGTDLGGPQVRSISPLFCERWLVLVVNCLEPFLLFWPCLGLVVTMVLPVTVVKQFWQFFGYVASYCDKFSDCLGDARDILLGTYEPNMPFSLTRTSVWYDVVVYCQEVSPTWNHLNGVQCESTYQLHPRSGRSQ